ncbi:hypothetical protein EGT41_07785 [Burkholderia cenocepacia]|uniref:Uncharacterized protein n=1 Tax=Burkholderia cenocepacia TaxID=95486 RepID=A0A3R9BQC3_9BURK|nr:hypothetical protein EGT41_07785 [Burkholderia cenocepacia]
MPASAVKRRPIPAHIDRCLAEPEPIRHGGRVPCCRHEYIAPPGHALLGVGILGRHPKRTGGATKARWSPASLLYRVKTRSKCLMRLKKRSTVL